jgi:hypothetical protein
LGGSSSIAGRDSNSNLASSAQPLYSHRITESELTELPSATQASSISSTSFKLQRRQSIDLNQDFDILIDEDL